MKVMGLLLLIGAGCLIGVYAALTLKTRVKALTLTRELLLFLQTRIQHTAAPLGALLQNAAAQTRFAPLTFLRQTAAGLQQGQTLPTAWRAGLQNRTDNLTEEDRATLLRFGDELGTTDLDGQMALLTLLMQQIEERLTTAREQATTKGKLYRTLGLCAGAAVALLLL